MLKLQKNTPEYTILQTFSIAGGCKKQDHAPQFGTTPSPGHKEDRQ
jgi:hypothetical protein